MKIFTFKKGVSFVWKRITFCIVAMSLMFVSMYVYGSILKAQSLSEYTKIGMDLRLVPTKIVVIPSNITVLEGSPDIQFKAMAYYEYGNSPVEVQPPVDITYDTNTVWESSNPNVALLYGLWGKVRPVSDLNQGSAIANIKATYGGVSGSGRIIVTGIVSPGGGGGGGGGSSGDGGGDSGGGDGSGDGGGDSGSGDGSGDGGGDSGSGDGSGDGGDGGVIGSGEDGDSGTGNGSGDGGGDSGTGDGGDSGEISNDGEGSGDGSSDGADSSGVENGESSGDSGEISNDGEGSGEGSGGGESGGSESGEGSSDGVESSGVHSDHGLSGGGYSSGEGEIESYQDSSSTDKGFISDSYLPIDFSLSKMVIRSLDEVFSPDELSFKEGETGLTRAIAVDRIADKTNFLKLREDLLNKCYSDLENCTAIFRMFSSYDGVKLDSKNTVLFPDMSGLSQEDSINKMALLGVVQGYYGIESSPFLPHKPILKIEVLKVLATVLDSLQKGSSKYQQTDFPFSALFYRDIYTASLLSKSEKQNASYNTSDLASQLIKKQKTPFNDIRPDINDNHWYYPIVINKICVPGLFVCKNGEMFNPETSPSLEELDRYISIFNKFIISHGLDKNAVADDDNDGILNIDENSVYLTNPLLSDTDVDGLDDGLEINLYKTNPTLSDTDEDGLLDGDELNKYKTNPILSDTDGDGFSDGVEIAEGSDPLRIESIPVDKNGNGVADSWEAKYDIFVVDGSQDTDGDGLSDLLEYRYGSNPTRVDSDMDGFMDAEEILELKTDPNDPNDPHDSQDLPVLINNFQYGQIVVDPSPLIKGVGPASLGNNRVGIQLLLRNEFGSELVLGNTTTDARGRFVFLPDIAIKNGTYFLLARSINKDKVKTSLPIKIVIDNTLEVSGVDLERLEDTPITDEVFIKNLTLTVDSYDGRPVLYGKLSEFGSRVNVTWQSLVMSSALIADTVDGSFSVKAPKLEPGKHFVYVQSIRKKDNAVGKTLKIEFELKLSDISKSASIKDKKNGLVGSVLVGIHQFAGEQSWPFWIGVVVFGVFVICGLYLRFGDKGNKKKDK